MQYAQIINDAKAKMTKGVSHFVEETKGLRSGRATPALIENIRVDYYGSPTPLKQVASISIPEPRALLIKPFDTSVLKEIEKAIQKSDIGINPQTDGKVMRLVVPPMSEEQRKKLVGRVKELAEAARVSLRNLRRDLNKAVDDATELTDDDVTKAKEEIQKLLKHAETEVDQNVAAKTKEIMET
ncbi:MAG: ribosome recycling factor [Planctomycetes bacterium]|nr:ribosome recycling factor [Planctomycetota bacterium]MCC7172297.1 ribosome recycling factor [Planctomycetota bacterium]